MKMSARRKIFYGATLAFVAALLLLPATGWLARLQLMPWTFAPLGSVVINGSQPSEAPPSSSDFGARFDYAVSGASLSCIERLEALNRETPHDVRIVAALLRVYANRCTPFPRPELELLKPVNQRGKAESRKKYTPAKVKESLALAAEGERLDPDNGYFPTMAGLAHFTAGSDKEAIAAWNRATIKPLWNDYITADVTARWELLETMHRGSEIGAVARMTSFGSTLLPHYATIRGGARLVTVKAMQAELAGHAEQGFRLRRANRQIGETMQKQSTVLIGNLVGSAVVGIASVRAGGAEVAVNPNPPKDGEEDEAWTQKKRNDYAAYLRSIGHPEEAAAYLSAMARHDVLRKICREHLDETYIGFGGKMVGLMSAWFGNILLLAGTFFALGFAGIFAVIYRFSPRLQRNEVLQKSARWGVWMGLIMPVLAAAAITNAETQLFMSGDAPLLIIGVAISTLALTPLVLRITTRKVAHGWGVMLATMLCAGVFGAIGAMLAALFGGFFAVAGVLDGAMAMEETRKAQAQWRVWLPVIVAGTMTCLPLLILGVFALFSRMLRIPVAAGVTRGTRSVAVPLACLLLLAWGASLFHTLRHENAAVAEMKRITQIGELRTIAEVSGQPYPP